MPSHRITHIKVVGKEKNSQSITHVRVDGLGKPYVEPIDTVIGSMKEGQVYYFIKDDCRVSVVFNEDENGKIFLRPSPAEAKDDALMKLPQFFITEPRHKKH